MSTMDPLQLAKVYRSEEEVYEAFKDSTSKNPEYGKT
jgi:hypothetical protein